MGEDELPWMEELLTEIRDGLKSTREEIGATRQQSVALEKRLATGEETLKAVNRKLPTFITRTHFWIAVVALVAVIGLAIFVGWKFHDNDVTRRARERAALVAENIRKRDDLVRGCERSNDQRATLRQVIEKAYSGAGEPLVLPPDTPPDLAAILNVLLASGKDRSSMNKAELLALPGVQPVDCEKAFPPPVPSKEAT